MSASVPAHAESKQSLSIEDTKSLYRKKVPTASSLCLGLNSRDLSDDLILRDLDTFNDKFIILVAREKLVASPRLEASAQPPVAMSMSQTETNQQRIKLSVSLGSTPIKIEDDPEDSTNPTVMSLPRDSLAPTNTVVNSEATENDDANYMKTILGMSNVDRLRAFSKPGTNFLGKIEARLLPLAGKPGIATLLSQVADLKKKAERQDFVICLMGETGAGKSSAINALLEEEQLVPTSGMCACTSVVTRIAWNDSDDPAQTYILVVETVTLQQWYDELSQCIAAVLDPETGKKTEDDKDSEGQRGMGQNQSCLS